jgi:UDP-glucuronate decarboxylase
MSVLVSGAAGFLGRHLVASLLADGQRVVGIDTFITSDREDLAPLRADQRFEFHELDVRDRRLLTLPSLAGCRAIYHLACPTGVPNLGPLGLEMLQTSVEGSRVVLELARTVDASVLLTSSAEVYGDPLETPQREDYTGNVDTLGPRKGYEEGKRCAETLFGLYAERHGVRALIARVFNTYGPGMRLTDTRVVPTFVRRALAGQALPVQGGGRQRRCHCYVDDLIAGLRRVMERGVPARAYNLGGESPTSVRALAERVIALTGSTGGWVSTERPGHDHGNHTPDITRARTELGWEPVTPLDAGLRATIEDFRARLAARGLLSGVAPVGTADGRDW